MFETPWMVTDQDERSVTEDRQSAQAAEARELEHAIANDHRRRDQMRAERGYVRAALGLTGGSGGASKG